MNNRFLTTAIFIASSTLFLAGCGGDSAFEDPAVTDPLNNSVVTQTPDQNSLSLAFEKLAVEAINKEGEAITATVYVADRNNNPVPNNTAVWFETNGGHIDPQCLTTDGICTVVWTEHDPTPSTLEATVIAYTRGEESFTDLNDNGSYDAGEPFTDISEPFFDLNNDTILNGTETFIDADNDNVFDVADGLFTGLPCIGDNTVCNRVSTLIWTSENIVLSGSFGVVSIVSGVLPTTVDTTAVLTIGVLDVNGKPMADGTTVAINSSDGSVEPSSFNFTPLGTQFILQYTTGSTAGISETLTIDVTSPSGAITSTLFFTSNLIKQAN